jgi:plastocyanin
MNTRKQVLIMSSLLMVMLMSIGAYAAWYPHRADDAAVHFTEITAERGALTFSLNCRLCHGDVGEGGAAAGRLAAAPQLNRPDLQAFQTTEATLTANANAQVTEISVSSAAELAPGAVILIDEERMTVNEVSGSTLTVARAAGHTEAAPHFSGAPIYLFDEVTFTDLSPSGLRAHILNTISCGRVGTAMPPWAQSEGGALNPEQIRQLSVVIMEGRWDLVAHENDAHDVIDAELTTPVTADATSIQVSDLSVFTEGQALRLGDERVRVTNIPSEEARPGSLTVERGALNTTPMDHPVETEIFTYSPAPTPSITEQSCGQIAGAAAPPSEPELVEDFEGQTVEIVAQGIAFDLSTIEVQAGGDVRVRLSNLDDAVQHNIAFYVSQSDLTPVADNAIGTTFEGATDGSAVDDTVFTIPEPGSYFYRCDVHPTIPAMTGQFTVQ